MVNTCSWACRRVDGGRDNDDDGNDTLARDAGGDDNDDDAFSNSRSGLISSGSISSDCSLTFSIITSSVYVISNTFGFPLTFTTKVLFCKLFTLLGDYLTYESPLVVTRLK